MLSLEKEDQIQSNGPGCVTCDLYEEFKHRYEFIIEKDFYCLDYKEIGLTDLYNTLINLKEDEMICFNNEMLNTIGWNEVRSKASIVCNNLGIKRKINPMIEIGNGIYSNNPELQKSKIVKNGIISKIKRIFRPTTAST